jgi:peptide/nickel transport system permease protein
MIGHRAADEPGALATHRSRFGIPPMLRRLLRVRMAGFSLAIVLIVVVAAIFAPLLAPYDPLAQDPYAGLQDPSWAHLLGTDQSGRDVLSRLIYGARVSLGISVGAVAFGIVLGVPLGLVSGYLLGVVDAVTMRAMDALVSFPGLILALGLVAALGPNLSNLIIAIGVANVPWLARIVRSQVLSIREQEYVTAARTVGASDVRILFNHIWPNSLAPVIVQSTLGMGYAVLAEASLSFLGVGVRPPTPTWGSMLQFAFGFLSIAPLLSIVPGVAIFLLVLAFNIIGDALRDVLDPRLRGRI